MQSADSSISFVIIGRNEEGSIEQCVESVINTVRLNKIEGCDILYIDSASEDSSIQLVKKHEDVSVYRLEGDYNASIARNVGAALSKGKYLFFIDGDMVLIPENTDAILSLLSKQQDQYLSFNFYDVSESGAVPYYAVSENEYTLNAGGLFLISRDLWDKLGGMRNCFRRSQDLDLALRSARVGVTPLRLSEPIARHHTIPYTDIGRLLKDVADGNYLYRGLLYRLNVFNRYLYSDYLLKEMSLCLLVLSVSLIALAQVYTVLLGYFGIVALKAFARHRISGTRYFGQYLSYLAYDTMTLVGFVSFFPKRKYAIDYVKV
jgi:glycosyltransferase involved in cell wall biosynthesis